MKLLYLAGPYTSPTQEGKAENIRAAREVAVELWKRGYSVICPHLNTAHMEEDGIDYETFMAGDLEQVRRCDGLILLKGWERSPGAKREMECARARGIPMVSLWSGILTDWDLQNLSAALTGRLPYRPNLRPGVNVRSGDARDFNSDPVAIGIGLQGSPFKDGSILQDAIRLTSVDRHNAYGPPSQHFARTIGAINSMIRDEYLKKDLPVEMWPKFLILDKVARSMSSYKRDNMRDVAGYAQTHEMLFEGQPSDPVAPRDDSWKADHCQDITR